MAILMPKIQCNFRVKYEVNGNNIDILSEQTIFVEAPPYMCNVQPGLVVSVAFQDDEFNRTLKALKDLMDTSAHLKIFVDQLDGSDQPICTWHYDEVTLAGIQPGPFNYVSGDGCYFLAQFNCEIIVPIIP